MREKTAEIIRIIRKTNSGQIVEDVWREENICVQTFYRWRHKYGRVEMADATPPFRPHVFRQTPVSATFPPKANS